MKKFIVVGSGTSGLIAASMIKRTWGAKCQVTVIYDGKKKNIGVGESTTPIINLLLDKYLKGLNDLLKNTSTTLKVGINFKNWIEGKEFFHGFPEIDWKESDGYPSALYTIINQRYKGGVLHNVADCSVPTNYYRKLNALHIDTQELSSYIYELLKDSVEFIDDVVEEVHSDGKNINGLTCRDGGHIEADYYIDCSGFDALLFKNLNPEWNDISNILPLDRAIPQQVPFEFDDIPSYTEAEATKNGWIWKIPIGNRYGTGYIYSSKFTSDEEAREDYSSWLKRSFNVELETDRIISYKPGYYTDYWIGNCLAIGLSSGFVEPLEATGIHTIVIQMENFIKHNLSLKGLEFNKRRCNALNNLFYKEVIEFLCLHYRTNRTDSDFWKYMKENQTDWVKSFAIKCKEEFLSSDDITEDKVFWTIDSYIQVANGLNMFDHESIRSFLDLQPNKEDLIESADNFARELNNAKETNTRLSHKEFLSNFR